MQLLEVTPGITDVKVVLIVVIVVVTLAGGKATVAPTFLIADNLESVSIVTGELTLQIVFGTEVDGGELY